jgi:hypothetical protein
MKAGQGRENGSAVGTNSGSNMCMNDLQRLSSKAKDLLSRAIQRPISKGLCSPDRDRAWPKGMPRHAHGQRAGLALLAGRARRFYGAGPGAAPIFGFGWGAPLSSLRSLSSPTTYLAPMEPMESRGQQQEGTVC